MVCSQCGAALDDGAKFCWSCGSALDSHASRSSANRPAGTKGVGKVAISPDGTIHVEHPKSNTAASPADGPCAWYRPAFFQRPFGQVRRDLEQLGCRLKAARGASDRPMEIAVLATGGESTLPKPFGLVRAPLSATLFLAPGAPLPEENGWIPLDAIPANTRIASAQAFISIPSKAIDALAVIGAVLDHAHLDAITLLAGDSAELIADARKRFAALIHPSGAAEKLWRAGASAAPCTGAAVSGSTSCGDAYTIRYLAYDGTSELSVAFTSEAPASEAI